MTVNTGIKGFVVRTDCPPRLTRTYFSALLFRYSKLNKQQKEKLLRRLKCLDMHDISSLPSWHTSRLTKPSGFSGLFFYFKAPTFLPRSYPTLNTQVADVEQVLSLESSLVDRISSHSCHPAATSAIYLFFCHKRDIFITPLTSSTVEGNWKIKAVASANVNQGYR